MKVKNGDNMNNNSKVNVMLTVDETNKLFIECGVLPKFTDGVNYVGCGTRSNTFSVNCKKSQYNVYCNTERFETVKTLKLTKTELVENGNAVDKTRPHKIVCKSTDELKKMILAVLKSDTKIALAK